MGVARGLLYIREELWVVFLNEVGKDSELSASPERRLNLTNPQPGAPWGGTMKVLSLRNHPENRPSTCYTKQRCEIIEV